MYLGVQSTDLLELHNILHAFSCYALYTKYETIEMQSSLNLIDLPTLKKNK